MSCDICYEPLINKVLLECKHELCVKCFLEMKPKKDFKCHMCRKEYKFIKEKQCITAPNTTIDNIIIIEEDEFSLRPLIQQRFPNECCLSFKVKKDNEELQYIVLSTSSAENIKDLIEDHVLTYGFSIQSLRQNNYNYDYIFMSNIDFYLQDYYDIILKRIICI